MEPSNLAEKQVVSHGRFQSSPIPNARPVFVPKLPPRPRQRGALPPTFAEPASFPQHSGASMQSLAQPSPRPFKKTSSSSSQQDASVKALIPPVEEQTLPQQPADSSTVWTQHEGVSQQGDSSKKRKKPAPLQKGQLPNAGTFSRAWHRVSPQESSHQRGALPLPQGQNYRPRQRGAILPPFQEQALQAPSAHTSSPPGPPFAPPTVAMEHILCPPLLQVKSSFSEMWRQLEGAIENRERMLTGMKAEMEKALSGAKVLKDDALKEKEEVEARRAGAKENMEIVSKQTGKIKSAREGLEHISTDLSVQVAELNHLLQQAQEQQRVLKVLESLKDHHDASDDENNFMFKNLHDCEVKLATMERELLGSKQTSELLEKAALKWTSDLEETEAGCRPPNYFAKNASNNPSLMSSILLDTAEIFSKTKMDAIASGLKGEREMSTHAATLKQPKLEVIS